MYDYRQIIHRIRMGQTDREIARTRTVGRTKCSQIRFIARSKGWLERDCALPDDAILAEVFGKKPGINPIHVSACRDYEEQILVWLGQGVCLTTICHALVDKFGFAGSYSSVRRLAQKLGHGKIAASCILDFNPAEAAQVDFGKGPDITDCFTGKEIRTWIFVMTLCFSRHIYSEIVEDQKLSTWLGCHRRAFEFFNGVPSKIIIDNPKCAITRACFRDPEVQRSYGELAEGYGFVISPCPPRDPQKKGRVESGVKYVKNSFVPLREFRSLADANAQLQRWVMQIAGNRIHGTTRQRPLSLFAEWEKNLLRALPDVPVELSCWAQLKVHKNCHIQFEKCSYSVPCQLMGKNVWLRATEKTVKVYHDLNLVAVHPRLKNPGSRSSVDEHMPPEALAWKRQSPRWCRGQAAEIGPSCLQIVEQLLADRILDNLRAVQGIIRLAIQYGPSRLEAACIRALGFDNPRYRTVKSILKQGLDQDRLHNDSAPLALIYSTGRFLRPSRDFKCRTQEAIL